MQKQRQAQRQETPSQDSSARRVGIAQQAKSIARTFAACLSMRVGVAIGAAVGLAMAVFHNWLSSRDLPDILTHFLANASFLATWLVAGLLVTGTIYFIWLGLRVVQPPGDNPNWWTAALQTLGPDPTVVSSSVLFVCSSISAVSALAGIFVWYAAISPSAQFEVKIGSESLMISPGGTVLISAEQGMHVRALLPPHLGRSSCEWYTLSDGHIFASEACNAYYHARGLVREDILTVDIYRNGNWVDRASFTIQVPAGDP